MPEGRDGEIYRGYFTASDSKVLGGYSGGPAVEVCDEGCRVIVVVNDGVRIMGSDCFRAALIDELLAEFRASRGI